MVPEPVKVPEISVNLICAADESVPVTLIIARVLLRVISWSIVTFTPTPILTWSAEVKLVGGAEPPHVTALVQLPETTAVYVVAEAISQTSIKDAKSNPNF